MKLLTDAEGQIKAATSHVEEVLRVDCSRRAPGKTRITRSDKNLRYYVVRGKLRYYVSTLMVTQGEGLVR